MVSGLQWLGDDIIQWLVSGLQWLESSRTARSQHDPTPPRVDFFVVDKHYTVI